MQEVKLNSRVKFSENGQKRFLDEALSALKIDIAGLAKATHVCDRTVRDWKREKSNMDFASLFLICSKTNTRFPKGIKVLPPYWSTKKASKLGGRRHAELYGSPGTPEGRRKGGINSQRKFKSDPFHAKRVGLLLRKKITYPKKSAVLAEFIGIMLGDGGVSNDHQITVSFNGEKDRYYALYIQRIIEDLFGITSTRCIRMEEGRANIVVTGKNLIEFLEKMGIKKGNKVKNQVDVPEWIFEHKEYQVSCLRGLFDTDGCVYQHSYEVKSKQYRYVKMCFRNYSIPILESLKKMLGNLGFNARLDKRQKAVYLHSPREVKKYISKVGTNNPRYKERYIEFFSKKIGRLGRVCEVAETGGLLSR